jgi:hypothetical protein
MKEVSLTDKVYVQVNWANTLVRYQGRRRKKKSITRSVKSQSIGSLELTRFFWRDLTTHLLYRWGMFLSFSSIFF